MITPDLIAPLLVEIASFSPKSRDQIPRRWAVACCSPCHFIRRHSDRLQLYIFLVLSCMRQSTWSTNSRWLMADACQPRVEQGHEGGGSIWTPADRNDSSSSSPFGFRMYQQTGRIQTKMHTARGPDQVGISRISYLLDPPRSSTVGLETVGGIVVAFVSCVSLRM